MEGITASIVVFLLMAIAFNYFVTKALKENQK